MEELKSVQSNMRTEENAKESHLSKGRKNETKIIIDSKSTHEEETHGRNDDIDESTSTDEVRAPGLWQRAKEEIEALVETMKEKLFKGRFSRSNSRNA